MASSWQGVTEYEPGCSMYTAMNKAFSDIMSQCFYFILAFGGAPKLRIIRICNRTSPYDLNAESRMHKRSSSGSLENTCFLAFYICLAQPPPPSHKKDKQTKLMMNPLFLDIVLLFDARRSKRPINKNIF